MKIAFFLANLILVAKTAPKETSPAPDRLVLTNDYVHQWIKFPNVTGFKIDGSSQSTWTSTLGKLGVIVFLSSSELNTQQQISKIRKIQQAARFTDFLYVFTQDIAVDAQGFSKHHDMEEAAMMLIDDPTKKAFHNPKPLTIYLCDRYGWLTHRIENPSVDELEKFESIISQLTSF